MGDPIAQMYQLRDEEGRERARQHRAPARRFRASELADCKRRMYYRQSGYVPAPNTGFQMDWSIDGDVHHDIVRQVLLNAGVRIAGITQNEDGTTDEDQFVSYDFDVHGLTLPVSTRQDGWIYHDDYGWMLMEIKSVGHWKYHYQMKAYEEGFEDAEGVRHPAGDGALLAYLYEKSPSYIYQVHAGMAIAKARGEGRLPFDASEPYTLDHAYLVIKDRSNCHIGYHSDTQGLLGGLVVPFCEDTWQKVLQRLYVTKQGLSKGVPPMPGYTAGSYQCKICPYKYACHDAIKRKQQGRKPYVVYPDPDVGLQFDDNDDDTDQASS